MRQFVDPLPRGVHLGRFFRADGTMPLVAVDSHGTQVAECSVSEPGEIEAVSISLLSLLNLRDPAPDHTPPLKPARTLRVMP